MYDIFENIKDIDDINLKIDNLFGYPNEKTKTETYRKTIKHPSLPLWAGIVTKSLIDKCAKMPLEGGAEYYDADSLKTHEQLKKEGWFPEPEVLQDEY